MNDMRATIIPKSDQMNADDLIGCTRTIRITDVSVVMGEQPVAISFEGDNGKPYKPGKSMRRVLVEMWGPDANQYRGRSLTLYRDEKVVFGGLAVGGIRISHMSDIIGSRTMALTVTRANKKPFTVLPLVETKTSGPEQRYPTLFGIKDGRIWLANLGAALGMAKDAGEVEAIGGLSSVATTLGQAPEAVRAEVRALLAGATARVAAEAPTFGDDVEASSETDADAEAEVIDNAPENAGA